MSVNIIVVGCGRVGTELAYRLCRKGCRVTVIDRLKIAFESLPPDFSGHTVEGEVLNQEVLHRAGILYAGGLAAVTNSDALNAVAAHVARTVFHVPRVVVRNYDPSWRPLHEHFGFQIVSSASWGAQRIEELLSDAPVSAVFSAGNGEVEIYEFSVPPTWKGHDLQELLPPGQCIAVALTRAGRAMLPSPETRLEADDVVHVSATWEGIEALQGRLSAGAPPVPHVDHSNEQVSPQNSQSQEV